MRDQNWQSLTNYDNSKDWELLNKIECIPYMVACDACGKKNKRVWNLPYVCRECFYKDRVFNGVTTIMYEAKKRDKWKCIACKSKSYIHTHHLDHDRLNNDLSNLITLCRNCHGFFHRNKNESKPLAMLLKEAKKHTKTCIKKKWKNNL